MGNICSCVARRLRFVLEPCSGTSERGGTERGGCDICVARACPDARHTNDTHAFPQSTFFVVSKSRLAASLVRHLLVTEKKRTPHLKVAEHHVGATSNHPYLIDHHLLKVHAQESTDSPRAKGTVQSLERGSSGMDLSTKFGKEIPSRNLREKRSVIRKHSFFFV